MTRSLFLLCGIELVVLAQVGPASAQQTEPSDIVVTGSRRADTAASESLAPVDSLDRDKLAASGQTDLNSVIQTAVPSFNFPRVSGFDATAAYRPASLRGLSPDQTLVLVNGKRWHRSAQVNVKPTGGRGSNPVDLNTIPLSAVDHIEVLRDGAAAQYGSDAIAGVINVLLDAKRSGASLSGSYGQRDAGDGEAIDLAGSAAIPLTQDGGFLRLSGQFIDRQRTNRAGLDTRQQYFAGDPREASVNRRNNRQGDPKLRQLNLFYNAELPLSETISFYSFGNYQDQRVDSQGNFRRPSDNNNVRALYPDGFLPAFRIDGEDYSALAGFRHAVDDNTFDLSASYSETGIDFSLRNTVNASLGLTSPREFEAGGLRSREWSVNFDGVRHVGLGLASPVTIAFGAGYRNESYAVRAGERASWVNGGVPVLDGPNTGTPTSPGSQGFPGFQPSDAGSLDRGSVSLYADIEADITDRLSASLAGRFEHYSDYGENVSGKASVRFEATPWLALRGAISNGFRAPTLGQRRYATTETAFLTVGNPPALIVADIKQLPVDNAAARALGARPLKAETSLNLSGGVVLTPGAGLTLAVDYYRIAIDDRVVLSENLLGPEVRAILANNGYAAAAGARFFTNGVDTTTQGVDVVGSYRHDLGAAGQVRLQAGFNWGETRVRSVRAGTLPGLPLIGRQAIGLIDHATPETKLILDATYEWQGLQLIARGVRYGEYRYIDNASATLDQVMAPQWVFDLDLSYKASKSLTLAVGANNLFNSTPERLSSNVLTTNGLFPYSALSPDGFSGAFYYTRARIAF